MAEEGRHGAVRFLGDVDHTPEAVRRLVTKLAGKYGRLLCAGVERPAQQVAPAFTVIVTWFDQTSGKSAQVHDRSRRSAPVRGNRFRQNSCQSECVGAPPLACV
jgi:hypothetical protein